MDEETQLSTAQNPVEKKIRSVEIEGEKIYLRKDWLGYRLVYPWKNEDGKKNWINILFGGKRQAINWLIILVLMGLLYLGINELISNYKIIAMNPCDFCSAMQSQSTGNFNLADLGIK